MPYFSCLRWSLASGSCGRQVPAEMVGCGAIHTSSCSLLLPNTRCGVTGLDELPGDGRAEAARPWETEARRGLVEDVCEEPKSAHSWPFHLAGPPTCPAVSKCGVCLVSVAAAQGHQNLCTAGMGGIAVCCCGGQVRAGGKGIGAKPFLLSLFPSGLLVAELSYLGHASPAIAVTPSAGCASGLAWLPLPCCWCQADLFSLPVLLPAQASLEGDAVLPALWLPLLRCPCPAGPWSTGLAPWSTGHRAARAPNKPLAGSGPRTRWQLCAFTWG